MNDFCKKITTNREFYEEFCRKLSANLIDPYSLSLEEREAYGRADEKFRERHYEDFIDASSKHPFPEPTPPSDAERIFAIFRRKIGLPRH